MSPYHWMVRLVGFDIGETRWNVELFDGQEWLPSSSPLPREQAEKRAKWLTDVLCHAEAEFEKRAVGDEYPR